MLRCKRHIEKLNLFAVHSKNKKAEHRTPDPLNHRKGDKIQLLVYKWSQA